MTKLGTIGLALGLAAAVTGTSSHADDHRGESTPHRHRAGGLQAISVSPQAGQPGHGWRYYSDAHKARAVVISPAGEYFFSDGAGLRQVFRPSPAA